MFEGSGNYDLLVCGNVVLPDRILRDGWVAVRGERIAAVGDGAYPSASHLHDAGNAFVLPGLIDGQTHATSYGGLPGLRSTTRSAIAGGVTTLVDMPYDNPDPLTSVDRLADKIAAIEAESHADVALYGTVAPGQGTSQMRLLAEYGVCAFKLSSFQSHPVRFPRLKADEMLDILEASVELGLPVGIHNEDQEIVNAVVASMKRKGLTQPEHHAPSRPIAAELSATAAFLALGLATGAHAHIVHVSCPEGFDLVRRFRDMGANATAEICAHYLHFDAARDIGRLGARMKVNPPIRAGLLPGLWQALQDDLVAFVSSDHSSWPLDNKLTPSIFDAGAGIPGLETLACSFYTDLLRHTDQPESMLVQHLSERPAKFFGLWPRKGSLTVGADADIVVLRPDDVVFREADTHDDLRWSPYEGERFAARISTTILRGRLVWGDGRILGQPGDGQYVARTY